MAPALLLGIVEFLGATGLSMQIRVLDGKKEKEGDTERDSEKDRKREKKSTDRERARARRERIRKRKREGCRVFGLGKTGNA